MKEINLAKKAERQALADMRKVGLKFDKPIDTMIRITGLDNPGIRRNSYKAVLI